MADLTMEQLELIQDGLRSRQRQTDFDGTEVRYLLEGNWTADSLNDGDYAQITAEGYRREAEVFQRAAELVRDHQRRESAERDAADAAIEAERVAGLSDSAHVAEAVEAFLKSRRVV